MSGPPIGFLMEKVGRKIILMILAVPFITGWLVKAASYNLAMMYVGRMMTGKCVTEEDKEFISTSHWHAYFVK
jgi:predicted MFS family arabinose efflux permease